MTPKPAFPQPSTPPPEVNSSAQRDARLKFMQLSEADVAALKTLWEKLGPQQDTFIDAFYQHLISFDRTALFLQDPQLVARLKESQRQHLKTMFQAQWDEDYEESRYRVGRVHAEVGVEPQFFLGAFNVYYQQFLQHILADLPTDFSSQLLPLSSLFKVMLLDVGWTLDAYFAQLTSELRSALDMYWRANNSLRQFANLTSHDLKTPLATVANLCDEVLDEFGHELPAEAHRMISAAQERTLRMSRMIDELLSFSVEERGLDTLDVIHSGEALQEALDRVKPLIDTQRIELQLPDHLPYVWGNKTGLCEAFYNLISNAVKYLDKQPGRIQISVTQEPQRAVFCISDNGPGIPAEELNRIFAPFRRLSRDRNRPGFGLGLYFAQSLIEEQGGSVWAESTPGTGSHFYLSLLRDSEVDTVK